ncbi:MAG: N-6 DNA methylase [Candidatus Aminicenantes bacterium]|nr:N-6 DNA methylase [Acidobacteriota bacterium]MCG2812867.1 N-6 DNA methylase [Candidatus Aminicenantes bacterium]
MLRRILAHLAIKKRQTARRGDRPAWYLHDLLFIVAYGEENDRAITLAHFWQDPQNPGNLAELKVLGWDGGDTVLHLADAHKMLTEKLCWPEDTRNINSWREKWASAFTLGHKEVIATTQELEVELARLAIAIRKRANSILSKESERGPLRNLFSVFKKTLIHDLTLEDFADVIAQTISYGLLAARLTSSSRISVQNLIEMMPATNPFLRDLLSSFLSVTGRGGNFDFDELGVQDVVELLNRANVVAVKRDFNNRTRDEDPVIHFYEHFLKAYDPEKKVKRGVFFTPQPVVSYIVRSVHKLLQTEFGLDDGLASIITWGEMAERNEDLKIPKDTKPEDHFVTILDPATGTATFLVEVINVIDRFLKEKWEKQGIPEDQQHSMWNDYVSKHLLPRLFGYELMMAPYVIAHLKIGIKLAETGYKFESDERARIYLTNALEPPIEQIRMENIIPALAHEAQAVNEIKLKQKFTVVIGNPPYSVSSNNKGLWIKELLADYKQHVKNEKNIQPLSDDYIKFIRFGQWLIGETGIGVFGMITNNSFLDGRIHTGVRKELLGNYSEIFVMNLHGSAVTGEIIPQGIEDQNVFSIRQGVSISFFIKNTVIQFKKKVKHAELWGERKFKFNFLALGSISTTKWTEISTISVNPESEWIPRDLSKSDEFDSFFELTSVFPIFTSGIKTHRDDLVIGNSEEDLKFNVKKLLEDFDKTLLSFSLVESGSFKKSKITLLSFSDIVQTIRPILYRPFDLKYIIFHPNFVERHRLPKMGHMLKQNLALVSKKGQIFGLNNYLVSNNLSELRYASAPGTIGTDYVFPLYLYPPSDQLNLLDKKNLKPNLSPKFIKIFCEKLKLNFIVENDGNLKETFNSKDLFYYAYCVFHSPVYRTRYKENLKREFPRLPLIANLELFRSLIRFGNELVALHLLESPELDNFITTYNGPKNPKVERVNWSENTVWLDTATTKKGQPAIPGTIGFRGVPEAAWNFHIGGYQVCEKWLKDRKGRTLSIDDIAHYQKIVVALNETIHLMEEIDKVIEKHGGWPGAFQKSGESQKDGK